MKQINNFYVYEWYIKATNEVIYVGKGCKRRYLCKKHNYLFSEMIKRFDCESRIFKEFETEDEAFKGEFDRVKYLKEKGQACCNIYNGGFGGETKSWTDEKRELYSVNNCMKSYKQRERMSNCNPMKNKIIASKVGLKHRKIYIIGDERFECLEKAAEKYGVTKSAVCLWAKLGHYKEKRVIKVNQQPSIASKSNEGSTTRE